ncbi:peptide synthetase [Trichodelitschia bisporula]|uniref:Peptide synthetase n=1 Tax=Trichodelitschia bisporula TaxID=703511 RepID=A0A6G1I994_9PEZI|nr:peptide synthetase [Trichodelitschia bisporula]
MGILTAAEPEGQREVGGPVKKRDSFGLPANSSGGSQHANAEVQQGDLGFLPFKLRPLAGELKERQEDILLLAWLLVLSRYSVDGDADLSWGHSELDDDGECEHNVSSTLSTADVRLDKGASALSLLEHVKAESSHGDDIFFFSDTASDLSDGNDKNTEASHMALNHVHSFVHIVNSIRSNPSAILSDILQINPWERAQLWHWNRELPPNIDVCTHDLISDRARKQPKDEAVYSWDGSLTYEEVEAYSTFLANQLVAQGVGVGTIVPLCFEKSRWTVVAVLAVMKAGGTFVLMDPSQPLARLHTIAEEVRATLIITSQKQFELGADVVPGGKAISIGQDNFQFDPSTQVFPKLPPVPPSAILYIIFTSGSTGKPKGVIISHETYTSGVIPRADMVGYNVDSRVLDFASYAFDVSIDSMLCTLMQGGCLCIPSNEDRVNDLNGVIRRMGVTMANMTPSVARVLDADIIPSLSSLGLGGESVSPRDVAAWGKHTRIVIGYGPSECTVGCTINSSAAKGRDYVDIGQATGAVLWLVDPDDYNRLTPLGGVGELLVEGPVVGQGYLHDPAKTATSFIEDPTWLLEGDGSGNGRHGRMYMTGDLVRYDPDGSGALVFVGRKDTQVKLRGQRVELGEVEHHLRTLLPSGVTVTAEVVAPKGHKGEPILVAFLAEDAERDSTDGPKPALAPTTVSARLEAALATMDKDLAQVLPVYMVPSAYIPVNFMPILVSGKTDRKSLRELAALGRLQQLAQNTSDGDKNGPETTMEKRLQQIWSAALSISADAITSGDNFFNIGGDSLTAMKLVATAREAGILLTVADIFRNPKLSEMASIAVAEDAADVEVLPFSVLADGWRMEDACAEAAAACGVDPAAIEDIYPCTPLQETLMAFSVKSTDVYIAQRVIELPDLERTEKLKAAWEAATTESPVLRTRIAQFPDRGLMQVIVKESITWQTGSNLEEYLARDRSTRVDLGDALSRYAIIWQGDKGYFVWTVHHALYDGWSTPLVLDRVKRAYEGLSTSRPAQMKHFVQWLSHPDRESSKDFWRLQLQNATGPQFPSLPSRTYLTKADALLQRYIPLKRHGNVTTTPATLIRAAWALVASQLTGSDDVIFGETFTGRSVPVKGADQIEGPMITTVPVRITIDRAAQIPEFLQRIHDQSIARIQHEHVGLQNIRRVSTDAQIACEVKTGLVIQPFEAVSEGEELLPGFKILGEADPAREALEFNSYALMLVCALRSDGFQLYASFDSNVIEVAQTERVLSQFECAFEQLAKGEAISVGDVSCLSEQDVVDIWRWNGPPPARIDAGGLVTGSGEPGFPRITVPWVVHSRHPERLAPIGAVGELLIEGPLASKDFIEDPAWLVAGYKHVSGRHGKLHRTGDLVRYRADGLLSFVGRKDTQAAFARLRSAHSQNKLAPRTDKERALQQLWSQVLDMDPAAITTEDSFFRLGGDSIMAMKLVSAARHAGYVLSVADVFRHMRLGNMATVLADGKEIAVSQVVKPFTSLGGIDVQDFLVQIKSALADPDSKIKDVLPLTGPQEMDIKATVDAPRSSFQYNILYLDPAVDLGRLLHGCQSLVAHHDILRTVFINTSDKYLQVVLEHLDVPVENFTTDSDLAKFTNEICAADIEKPCPLGSTFLKFFFIRSVSKNAFVFRISHAQYDGVSLAELMRQFNLAYHNEKLPSTPPFASYINHMITARPAATEYWRIRLAGAALTRLPPLTPEKSTKPVFLTRDIDVSAKPANITLATMLSAAWALVLSRTLSKRDIVFGSVASGRSIDLPDVGSIVGPCYQFTPVRTTFADGWTSTDLLRAVQAQYAEALPHEHLGMPDIVRCCTDWDAGAWFDSLVHHQDVAYFDDMPFGEGKAGVDALLPHAESVDVWRVVSFPRGGGVLRLGIETSESWGVFAGELLGGLEEAVRGFVERPEEVLVR